MEEPGTDRLPAAADRKSKTDDPVDDTPLLVLVATLLDPVALPIDGEGTVPTADPEESVLRTDAFDGVALDLRKDFASAQTIPAEDAASALQPVPIEGEGQARLQQGEYHAFPDAASRERARESFGLADPRPSPPQAGQTPAEPATVPQAAQENAPAPERLNRPRVRTATATPTALTGPRLAPVLRFPSRDDSAAEPPGAGRLAATPTIEAAVRLGTAAEAVGPTLVWVAPQERSANDPTPRDVDAPTAGAVANDLQRALTGSGGTFDSETSGDQRRAATPSVPSATRVVPIVQPPVAFDMTAGAARIESNVATLAGSIPNQSANATTIVQSIRLQSQNGVGTAVVNLDPGYLGTVSISLRVEKGAVTATVHAEHAQVRAWLEVNEPTLRQGLADQGLSLDRLLVSQNRSKEERGSSDARRRQDEQEPQKPPRKFSRPDSLSTFDVIV